MKHKIFIPAAAVLATALLAGSCNSKKETAAKVDAGALSEAGIALSELKVVTVDMDTVNEGFQMVTDIQNELAATEKRLTADIQRQANQWQKDYDNYLKIGATLTLSEQKKREEALTQRQQDLAELQQKYASQLANLQVQRMEEMRVFILDYLKKFEAENGPFSLIMMVGANSGVLYSQPSMDITSVVLPGLNEAYKETLKK